MMRRPTLMLWLLALACLTAVALARPRKSMVDPLFGISYDPQTANFEQAPAGIKEECSLHSQKTWIYAHLKARDTEYFIVSGLTEMCPDGPGPCDLSPDVAGTIVALRGSKCGAEAVDSFYWRNDSPIWNLSEPELNNLAWDALQRYAKAFGGKRPFLNKVIHRDHLAPVLRKQLEVFEKQAGE